MVYLSIGMMVVQVEKSVRVEEKEMGEVKLRTVGKKSLWFSYATGT